MRNYFSPKEWGLLFSLVLHLIIVLYLSTKVSPAPGSVEEEYIAIDLSQFEEEIPIEEEALEEEIEPLVPALEPNTNTASQQASSDENLNTNKASEPSKSEDEINSNKEDLLNDLLDKYGTDISTPDIKKEETKRIRREGKDGVGIVDPYTGESNIYYRLPGREDVNIPNPIYPCEKGGKVTVSIVVDWQGNVTKAEIVKTKSVRNSYCLYDQAIEAAKKSKFNSYSYYKMPEMGTITFYFKAQ